MFANGDSYYEVLIKLYQGISKGIEDNTGFHSERKVASSLSVLPPYQPKVTYCTPQKNIEIPFSSIQNQNEELDLMGKNMIDAVEMERKRLYR